MPPRKPKPHQTSRSQSRGKYKENILFQEKCAVTLKQNQPPEILKPSQPIVPGNRNHIKFESPIKKAPKMPAANNHLKFISPINGLQNGQNENINSIDPVYCTTASPQKRSQSHKMVGVVKKTGSVEISPGILAPIVEEDKNRHEMEGSPSKIARAEKKRQNRQAKREKQKLQREAKKKASRLSKDDVDTEDFEDVEDVEMADVVESEKEEYLRISKTYFTSSPRSSKEVQNIEQKTYTEDDVEVEVEMDTKYGFGRFSASNIDEFLELANAIDDNTDEMDSKSPEKVENATDPQMTYYWERFSVRFGNWLDSISGGGDIRQILDTFKVNDLGSQQSPAANEMMAFKEKYWTMCCFHIDTVINKGWSEDIITKGEDMLEDLMRMHNKLLKDENIWIVGLNHPFHDFGHHDDHYEEKVKFKLGLGGD